MADNWWEEVSSSVGTDVEAEDEWWKVAEQTDQVLAPASQPYNAALISENINNGVPASAIVESLMSDGATSLNVNESTFDLAGAVEAGVSDDEIVKILTTGEGYRKTAGQVDALGQGVNLGLSNMFGAPVDGVNWLAGQAERGGRALYNLVAEDDVSTELTDTYLYSDEPALGSKSIRRGLNAQQQVMGGEGQIDDISELDPEYRAAAQAGRVVGETIPMALTPFALAAKGIGTSHPIVARAASNPTALLADESLTAAGAAQFAALAQVLAPDNQYASMAGEFLGAVVNPVGIAVRTGQRIAGASTGGIRRMLKTKFGGEAGAQDVAVQEILKAAESQGVSPEMILESLKAAGTSPTPLTAGQATGNPILIAFENNLASQSGEFRDLRKQNILDAFSNLRGTAETLLRSGDEATQLVGADLQKIHFRNLLNLAVDNAREAATVAAGRFDDADARGASNAAYEALNTAKAQVRTVESALWKEIDQTISMDGAGLKATRDSIKDEILSTQNVGGADGAIHVNGIMRKIKEGTLTSRDVLVFRSEMLNISRKLASSSDFAEARRINLLADAALGELDNIPGNAADVARDFSRNLNERFTQGFPSRVLGRTGSGETRINPERTLEVGFGAGKTSGAVNLEQMREATRFSDEAAGAATQAKGDPTVAPDGSEIVETAGEMFSAQEQFIRATVSNLKDATTGVLDPKKVDRFIAQNPDVLDQFPNIKTDMLDAAQAQTVAKEMVDSIGKVAETEDLARAIGEVFSSRTPAADFEALAKLAPDGDSVAGLRNSVIDWASNAATTADGGFDFLKFAQNLAKPIGENGKTAFDIMLDNGVMSEDQLSGMGELINEGIRLQLVDKSKSFVDDIVKENGAMVNNIARLLGANVFTSLGRGDASLQAAAIGSQYFKNMIDKFPRLRTKEAMETLLKNPELLSAAISRNPSVQKSARDTVSEYIVSVSERYSERGISGLAMDGSARALNSLEDATFSRRTGRANALINTDEFTEDEAVTPPSSLEDQTQQAFPNVNLPKFYFDENGNPIAPPGF